MQRVAIIGLGPIGNLHARQYAGCPGAELAGVCDIIPARADAAAGRGWIGTRGAGSTFASARFARM